MVTWREPPAGDGRDAERTAPAGTSGEDARARWKAALAAHAKATRRGAGRYVRLADRTAGGRWRPGMGRRMPEPEGDDAA